MVVQSETGNRNAYGQAMRDGVKAIMLSYKRVKNEHFLVNGKSTIRVEPVLTMPSPVSEGRTVKIFQVQQIVRENPDNPIPRGAMLAVSFPTDKLGATEYTWDKPFEETFVPYEIKDHQANLDAVRKN